MQILTLVLLKIVVGNSYSTLISVVHKKNLVEESNLDKAFNCTNRFFVQENILPDDWGIRVSLTDLSEKLINKSQQSIEIRNNPNVTAVIGPTCSEDVEFLYSFLSSKSLPIIIPLQQKNLDNRDNTWLVEMTKSFRINEVRSITY